ncbi:Rv1733c family protein [Streptomyces sp. 900105755]|uniref:Rv1733c family protein n=1 Tax=Streptomyces sp. NPDC001507 TaxID=3364579 RepID=UPI00369A5B3C
MRTRVRGWRWRYNPLRRRSDVVEAWIALAVAVLLCVGGPLVGAVAGLWAHDQAQSVAAVERSERHMVRAVVVGGTPEQLPSVQGGDQAHAYQTNVRWTVPGTGTQTALARVPAGTRTGDAVDVWFDRQGHAVAPPPDDVAVWQHTVTVGLCGASGAAAVVLLGHGIVRRVALRHRLAEWEQEWARTGPDWTRGRA